MSPKILIADDDDAIREVLGFALEKEGFEVIQAADGAQALAAAEREAPDLVVLDVLMPEMDGTQVCLKVRAFSEMPIIFLSSKDAEIDRILGLELGGDDYVTKPFSPRELIARIRATLRRIGSQKNTRPSPDLRVKTLSHGPLRLNLDSFEAFWHDRALPLTPTEFDILACLMTRPGRVYTRENLMDGAYGPGHYVSGRTIDSHVKSLRKKLRVMGADPIRTSHGRGYLLALPQATEGNSP